MLSLTIYTIPSGVKALLYLLLVGTNLGAWDVLSQESQSAGSFIFSYLNGFFPGNRRYTQTFAISGSVGRCVQGGMGGRGESIIL